MTYQDWPVESTAFIGNPGGLVPVLFTLGSRVKVDENAGYNFRRTVTGRVHTQRCLYTRREWSVTLESYPTSYLAPLRAISGGAYGAGPFNWVTPYAQATNLVTPDDSLMMGINNGAGGYSLGGPKALDGQLLPQSIVIGSNPGSAPVQLCKPIPLNPSGGAITASAWLRGNVRLIFTWITTSGAQKQADSGTRPLDTKGVWERVVLTQTPPADAVAAFVSAVGATGIAGTQIVWSDVAPQTYEMGNGCWKAAISELPAAYGAIDREGTWGEVSFTVTELG